MYQFNSSLEFVNKFHIILWVITTDFNIYFILAEYLHIHGVSKMHII